MSQCQQHHKPPCSTTHLHWHGAWGHLPPLAKKYRQDPGDIFYQNGGASVKTLNSILQAFLDSSEPHQMEFNVQILPKERPVFRGRKPWAKQMLYYSQIKAQASSTLDLKNPIDVPTKP